MTTHRHGDGPHAAPTQTELSPRMRRMLEIVYAIDGVAAARVWQWPAENGLKRIAVAVRPSPRASPQELIQRVEAAISGLREPDESWEFGLLET